VIACQERTRVMRPVDPSQGRSPRLALLFAIAVSVTLAGCASLATEGKQEIAPFVSDRCSLYPEGPVNDKEAWCHCCVDHDLSYWMGGGEGDRQRADETLQQCVTQSGHSSVAAWMHLGVRSFGGPYWPTGYRWGYGWPYLRGYRELSTQEQTRLDIERARLDDYVRLYCGSDD